MNNMGRRRGKCRMQLALLYEICNTPLLHSTSWISPICLNNNVKLVYLSVKDLLDWYVSIVLFIFPSCYSFISLLSLSLYYLVVFLSRGNAEGIFCLVLTMDTFFLCCIIFLKRLSFCVNMTWSFWWWSDLIIVVVLNSLHLISFFYWKNFII